MTASPSNFSLLLFWLSCYEIAVHQELSVHTINGPFGSHCEMNTLAKKAKSKWTVLPFVAAYVPTD